MRSRSRAITSRVMIPFQPQVTWELFAEGGEANWGASSATVGSLRCCQGRSWAAAVVRHAPTDRRRSKLRVIGDFMGVVVGPLLDESDGRRLPQSMTVRPA